MRADGIFTSPGGPARSSPAPEYSQYRYSPITAGSRAFSDRRDTAPPGQGSSVSEAFEPFRLGSAVDGGSPFHDNQTTSRNTGRCCWALHPLWVACLLGGRSHAHRIGLCPRSP